MLIHPFYRWGHLAEGEDKIKLQVFQFPHMHSFNHTVLSLNMKSVSNVTGIKKQNQKQRKGPDGYQSTWFQVLTHPLPAKVQLMPTDCNMLIMLDQDFSGALLSGGLSNFCSFLDQSYCIYLH